MILAHTNDILDILNNYILTLISRDNGAYLSVYNPFSFGENNNSPYDIYTLEFLNNIMVLRLSNHWVKPQNWSIIE